MLEQSEAAEHFRIFFDACSSDERKVPVQRDFYFGGEVVHRSNSTRIDAFHHQVSNTVDGSSTMLNAMNVARHSGPWTNGQYQPGMRTPSTESLFQRCPARVQGMPPRSEDSHSEAVAREIRMYGRSGSFSMSMQQSVAARVANATVTRRKHTESDQPAQGVKQCRKRRRKAKAPPYEPPFPVVRRSPPTIDEFFEFMRERECIRIRRELDKSPQPWTHDKILQRVHLTNVKREMDSTTRVMREITTAQANSSWSQLSKHGDYLKTSEPSRRNPWTTQQLEMAGLFVFNCALWRAFGTLEFAKALGFLKSWGPQTERYTESVAFELWRRGVSVFTRAYDPARRKHMLEFSRRARDCPDYIRGLIRSVFRAVAPVWEARRKIAERAFQTASWRKTTERLMQVPGYGGTGFLAKEVVQDLLHTPVFQDLNEDQPNSTFWYSVCIDENSWCAVGPGARRGLNRIAGRNLKHGITDGSYSSEKFFLGELKEIYAGRKDKDRWPVKLLERDLEDLALHDVQFQLCEFDKYLRAKFAEGRVRLFIPRATTSLPWEDTEELVIDATEIELSDSDCSS
jgi:hypothetical protein